MRERDAYTPNQITGGFYVMKLKKIGTLSIFKAIALLVIASMVLSACSGGGGAATPIVEPVPEAPEVDNQAQAVETGTVAEMTIINPDGTATPLPLDSSVIAIPAPMPSEPTIETLYLDIEAGAEFMPLFEALIAESQTNNGSGGHLAMVAYRPKAAPGCDSQATNIIRHVFNDKDRIPPELKFAGSPEWYLQRLIQMWTAGKIGLRGFVQGPDGTGAFWLYWFDDLTQRTRETMILIGAKPWEGSIYPMGEPFVISRYGPLATHVVEKFQEIAAYNPATGFADERSVVVLTAEALAMIGGAAALDMGLRKLDQYSETLKNVLSIWGACLDRALNNNPKYKAWKDSQKPKEFTVISDSTNVVIFTTKEDAEAAAATMLLIVGAVIVVKIIIAGGTGQIWILAVPTPIG